MSRIQVKDIIKSPLPDLHMGASHTTSSAIHDLAYVGDLAQWKDFERTCWNYSQNTTWGSHRAILEHRPKGPTHAHSLDNEHVYVGDEMGVLARFHQNVGQPLTATCQVFGLDVSFGDYKATTDRSLKGRVPDSACMTSQGELQIPGEMKTDWVPKHDLPNAIARGGNHLKKIFGQIARYMRLAKARYGYLSTYKWTIFLRQVEKPGGKWGLEYSPAIKYSAEAGPNVGEVTVREVFWFLLSQGAGGGFRANNDMAMTIWVVHKKLLST